MELRRLNKVLKERLLEFVDQKDVRVSMTGNVSLYVINVKDAKTGQKIFSYKHTKNNDSVLVGEECVACSVFVSEDMKDLQRALVKRMDQDEKARQIEIDRKNMMPYDLRAIEFLKQYRSR